MIKLISISLLLMVLSSTALAREIGSSKVIANLPNSPGFPEGTVRIGKRILVSGPGDFHINPSKIYEYDLHGRLIREYAIEGELQYIDAQPVPFGVAGIAKDANLNVYVASTSLGIIKINWWKFYLHDYCMSFSNNEVCDYILNNMQEVYAPIPDLPRCEEVGGVEPCSPTHECSEFTGYNMPCFPVTGRPAMPNDMAFGPNGELYVTDTMQATIWKIPYGGGKAEIFFQDERLDAPFGPNGIRVNPNTSEVFFAVTGGFPVFKDYEIGRIYRLPLNDPQPQDLELFHEFELMSVPVEDDASMLSASQGPDGIGFSREGNLFVTLAFANNIVKLDQQGNEIERYAGPAYNKDWQEIPWAGPATFVFFGRRIIFANHALVERDPSLFILGDLFVGEHGEWLNLPWQP